MDRSEVYLEWIKKHADRDPIGREGKQRIQGDGLVFSSAPDDEEEEA